MRTLLVLMTLFCSFLTAQDRPRARRPDGEAPMRRELRSEMRERWMQRQGQRGERMPPRRAMEEGRAERRHEMRAPERDGARRLFRHRGLRHERTEGRNGGVMPEPRERLRVLRERIRELRAEMQDREGRRVRGGDRGRPRGGLRMRDV